MAPGIDVGGWNWNPGRPDESIGALARKVREHMTGSEKIVIGSGRQKYTVMVKWKHLLLLAMLEGAAGGSAEDRELVREYFFGLLL